MGADDIAKAILDIINTTAVAANGSAELLPILTKDYSRPARNPLNSVLDCIRQPRRRLLRKCVPLTLVACTVITDRGRYVG
jgi:hypothetical protein